MDRPIAMGGSRQKMGRAMLAGASLLVASCLCACAPQGAPVMAEAAGPAPVASATPAPMPQTPWERLCACPWVDAYDSSFTLTFDMLSSQMIERNDAAGIKKASRVTVEEEAIVVYDEMGVISTRLPYTLEAGTLRIDYGEALGELEYKAAR